MAREITPEQVEALRREFQKLQDQINSLEFPKDASDGLDQFNKALTESYAAIDQQERVLKDLNRQLDHQLTALGRLTAGTPEYAAQLDRVAESQTAVNDATVNLGGSFAKLEASLIGNQDQLKKAGAASQLYAEALEALKRSQDAALTVAEQTDAYDEYIAKLREASAELREFTNDVKFGEDTFDGLQQSILGISGPFKSVIDMASKGQGGMQGFASEMMEGIKSGELLGNAMLKLVKVSFDFAMEQDKVFSEFQKSTGAGKEFNQVIKDIEGSGRIAGVTLAEASAATRELKNTFTDFTYYNKETQKEIGQTVTILGEMGFSFGNQAKIMQTATKSLGMGVEGAQKVLLDLAGAATSLGVDVDTLSGQFVAQSETLSRFGKNATKVFKDMAKTAKATGIELGNLMGFMEQFTKFDSAAQSVGRLNAILGGPYLNSIDMLNASMEDPIEGIKMLKGAFDEAGVSADNVSSAELLAFSSALGMSVEDTRKMMSKSNAELTLQAMTMEEASKKAAEAQAITEKLANAFKQLYLDAEPFVSNVLMPMIDGFASFMGWIGEMTRSMGVFANTAIFAGMAIAGLMIATGVGSPWGIAGLAVLGGVSVGAFSESAAGEKAADEKAAGQGPGLENFSSGGRVSQRRKGYADGGRTPMSDFIASTALDLSEQGGIVGAAGEALYDWVSPHTSGMMAASAVAGAPGVPIRMNEANRKEMATVPAGTMISNADDTKQVIETNRAMITEIQGLRQDLARAAGANSGKKVQLVLDNGKEFAATVVESGLSFGRILSPFNR